jgi:hypothetical protein
MLQKTNLFYFVFMFLEFSNFYVFLFLELFFDEPAMVLRYLIDATALHHSTVSTGLTPL